MHTPGPWKVITPTNARGQDLPPKVIQEGSKGGFICSLGIEGGGKREDNAQLIAAAPDLLTTLKACVREIEAAQKHTQNVWCPDWFQHKRAVELIAKLEAS